MWGIGHLVVPGGQVLHDVLYLSVDKIFISVDEIDIAKLYFFVMKLMICRDF